ncbi:MAG: hypothetical protein CTY20_03845 [Hyphomicrobium sp.]|nr:MAG: hypothetical protein CTY20_03845 [Hyphomicrobium sp.]
MGADQSRSVRSVWTAIATVASVQLAVLGYIVFDRVRLLSAGREIVLDVVPVDPRSLFRGDYVILSYDISRISSALLEGKLAKGAPLFVTIAQDAADKWNVVRVAAELVVSAMPEAGTAPAAKQVVMKARSDAWRSAATGDRTEPIFARYGIESYFVPEGQGLELEQLVGEKKIKAVVAVGRDGTAALKGLMVDGKLVYREPLI